MQGEVGTYNLAAANLDMEVTLRDNHLLLNVPGQPAYTLENVGGRRYKFVTEAPGNFFITFRPAKRSASDTEAYLEQPQGNVVLRKRKAGETATATKAAAEFTSAITVDELMAKVVAAHGGEENLRKHKSMVATYAIEFPNQGLTGEATSSTRAPNSAAQSLSFIALGKKIGTLREFFDGTSGSTETSFSPPDVKSAKQIENARVQYDFYARPNWRTLFKSVEIKKLESIGGEDAYVVEMTPERGNPITEYVSAKSFLVLKRETHVPADNESNGPTIEIYSDYRLVDGVMISFKTIQQSLGLGEAIIQLKEAKFDVALPDSLFRAQKKK
jgi:hypothetical protein